MKYFMGYRFKAIIALGAKLLEAVFELILPLIMIQIISSQSQQDLWSYAAMMLFLVILGYGSSMLCQLWASQVSQGVGGKMRSAIFRHIQSFSLADYDVFTESALSNRIIVDTSQVQLMIAMFIRLVSRTPILMIGSIISLYRINPRLALYLCYSFPVFIAAIALFMVLSLRYHKRAQSRLDDLIRRVIESLSGARVIRAFNKEERFEQEFDKANRDLLRDQRRAGKITALSTPTITFLMNITLLLLVYSSAFEINQGLMNPADMIAVINYCTQLVLTLVVMSNLVMIFSRGFTSYRRIQDLMSHQPSIADEGEEILEEGPLHIRFAGVDFAYPNEKHHVLQDINLEIKAGETLGIIGLTGSGKSTLAQLIARFYDVSAGHIYLNGKDIKSYRLDSLRAKVAYIAQSPEFIPESMEENINMMQSHEDSSSFLKQAQGNELLKKGMDYQIRDDGSNLSGGQRQRINIARALMKNSGLLIFDDSFSALDYLTDRRLREMLQEEYADTTQIIISQKTASFQYADRIVVLVDGKIAAIDSHENLVEAVPLYADIVKLQAELSL